jgi:Zn-dependent peptidase ImmA (M78 family)
MKFEINGSEWEIIIVSEDKMNNEEKNDYTLGLTIYSKQEVWLVENQVNMIKTLIHELTHVWLFEYGHNAQEREFNHEDVCEIVASSNNFINKIVQKFAKTM